MDPTEPPTLAAPISEQRTPGQSSSSPLFEFNRPTVIALLYLCTPLFALSAIVGVVLAYVWRGELHEGAAWEWAHYTFHIRTFWLMIAALVAVIALVLAFLWFGEGAVGNREIPALLIPAAAVAAMPFFLAARCIFALVRAQSRLPMPRPRNLLF